ncbi:MAG: methylmalonyl-CoA mutase [Alphaproteobacteria bacterium]|nr:methylmalonyl-CoA mutase [Alphaproteobacteria bacterium]MCB9696486.1 methylmalonyl-CoA mutase [Alphaproteobacteria bacterium]
MTEDDLRRWRERTWGKAVARVPERPHLTRSGGEPVAPLYTPLDAPDFARVGFPGEHPYTRGVQPTMYRGSLWTMRQYAGFGTARQSNERYRYLLSQGTTGLSVAFDLPTQMGYDSDHALAMGEVGRVGVAIDSLHDMRVLFDGIPLDEVSTSMTINATASTLLALYVAVGKEQGVAASQLRGTIQNDVLKEYIARGTYIYPPRASMRIITDLFRWCAAEVPKWNTISISGYHIREAGSTAAQELAFTLADGIAYVEAAIAAGLPVDDFAPRLSFFFNAHNDLIEEVAKFRAARRIWANLMRDRFGAKNPKSCMLRFHTQTAGSTLAARQIDNNVVRVTLQALAAVLGGTQSLHTNSRDEALALPTEASVKLALRTQQVIAHESGVAAYVDPLGGSWALERVTDELEAEALRLIAEIDGMGGMVEAIERGFPQQEIQNAAYAAQLAIDRGESVVVGVNRFEEEAEPMPELLRIDPAIEAEQAASTRAWRANRDPVVVRDRLDALTQAASGTDGVMPHILGAVEAGVTLGEIADALRAVFGEYREQPFL